jgi:type I restriction enzyme M protein
MAEHLKSQGRAGIIVPEGIIFQSQTAYTQLRKVLVEEYLVAVVSLPTGVFNPYSGVKTSILILDKSLARQVQTVAFFKIENDGFGLGAQRREIDKNDLPQARAELAEYLRRLRARESVEDFHPTLGLIVPKEKITANGDYTLSGERYREAMVNSHSFPLVRMGEVCTVNPRKSQLADLPPETRVSFVPMADLNEHHMAFQPSDVKQLSEVSASYTYFEDGDVLLAKVTPCFENGKAGIARGLLNGIGFGSSEFYVLRSNGQVLPEWVYFCVMHPLFRESGVAQMTGTGGLQRIPRDYVENFQLPLPPLEMQKEIVAEIEGYQKVIDGARAVLDNYRPHIPIYPDWPMVQIGEVCDLYQPKTITQQDLVEDGPYLVFGANGVIGRYNQYNHEEAEVLITCRGATCGAINMSEPKSWVTGNAMVAKPKDERLSKAFLFSLLKGSDLGPTISGSAQPQITRQGLAPFEIPLPPLATQQAIVAEIEAEQVLVAANRELITRFEKKIQGTLVRVWGEDATPASAED